LAVEERGGRPAPATQIQAHLGFTSLWGRAIGDLCRRRGIPLVFGDDTTFFEKTEPNQIERDSLLGKSRNETQERQFATHRAFFPRFRERRAALATMLGVSLAGPGPGNALSFIDEFHYDADGTRVLCDDLVRAIEPLL
jgi:hypothetical protein